MFAKLMKPVGWIIIIGIVCFLITWWVNYPSINFETFLEVMKEGIKHFWPEVIVAIFIYFFLDEGFKKIYEIPKNKMRQRVAEILGVFKKSPENAEIWILDTSLYQLMCGRGRKLSRIDEDAYELFWKSLLTAIQKNNRIKILLLHPDTYAAYQRNKDLLNEGYDFSKEIRRSLRRLNSAACEIKKFDNALDVSKCLEIKLYKATPVMKLIRWHDFTSFTLLPPNNKASKASRIQTTDDSELGHYLAEYFANIWDASNDDFDNNSPENVTIDFFEDFLTVKLKCPGWNPPQDDDGLICWGGGEFNLFKPKYLLFHDNAGLYTHLRTQWENYENGRRTKVGLVLKHGREVKEEPVHINSVINWNGKEDPVYDNAFFKISKNYNWDKTHEKNFVFYRNEIINIKYGSPIIEIKYDSEDFQVTTDRYEISEFLDSQTVGYKFLSNKQLNINLTRGFLSTMNAMEPLFANLPLDEEDQKFCKKKNTESKQIRKKSYVGRQRILILYTIQMEDGQIVYKQIDRENSNYYEGDKNGKLAYPAKSNYRLEDDNEIPDPVFKKASVRKKQFELQKKYFHDLQFMLDKKSEDDITPLFNELEMHSIPKFLKSIVQFDFNNIIDYKDSDKTIWHVYMHLIRNAVAENEIGIITPEVQDKDFDYKAVHLMKRDKIKGGITQIIDAKNVVKESYSLETSFDSVYLNCRGKKMKVSPVEFEDVHKTDHKELKGDNKTGKRDVIVLEFKSYPT